MKKKPDLEVPLYVATGVGAAAECVSSFSQPSELKDTLDLVRIASKSVKEGIEIGKISENGMQSDRSQNAIFFELLRGLNDKLIRDLEQLPPVDGFVSTVRKAFGSLARVGRVVVGMAADENRRRAVEEALDAAEDELEKLSQETRRLRAVKARNKTSKVKAVRHRQVKSRGKRKVRNSEQARSR